MQVYFHFILLPQGKLKSHWEREENLSNRLMLTCYEIHRQFCSLRNRCGVSIVLLKSFSLNKIDIYGLSITRQGEQIEAILGLFALGMIKHQNSLCLGRSEHCSKYKWIKDKQLPWLNRYFHLEFFPICYSFSWLNSNWTPVEDCCFGYSLYTFFLSVVQASTSSLE